MSSPTYLATDGVQLPVGDLPVIYGHSGSLLTTMTVEYPAASGKIYIKTYTYDGTLLATESRWVRQ